jgi:NB-ARC domain
VLKLLRRWDQMLVLLAGLVPVGLAVAINVATGGRLPRPLAPYGAWAWPAVGILAMASAGLTAWQLLQGTRKGGPEGDDSAAGSYVDQAGATIAGRDLYQYQIGSHVSMGGEVIDKVVTIDAARGDVRVTAKSNQTIPAQLPLDIADFTGREDELSALRRYVTRQAGSSSAAVPILTIKGKPGIGKSALAIHFAHELRPQFPDAQLFASLRGTDPEPKRIAAIAVLGQFLRALGVQDAEIPAALEDASARYRSELAGRRAVVVLDNAADEAQVRPLLPGSPGCVVLITSRGQLAALAGGASLTVDVLPEDDAIALLARLGGEDRIAADPADAIAVVRHCGYLPLALRIAGAKLGTRPAWTSAELAVRLADERRRLEELRVGDLAVRASFALSYQSLAPVQARVFRLLGLLDGPDMAPATVAALAETTLREAEGLLESLLDAHLLQQAV